MNNIEGLLVFRFDVRLFRIEKNPFQSNAYVNVTRSYGTSFLMKTKSFSNSTKHPLVHFPHSIAKTCVITPKKYDFHSRIQQEIFWRSSPSPADLWQDFCSPPRFRVIVRNSLKKFHNNHTRDKWGILVIFPGAVFWEIDDDASRRATREVEYHTSWQNLGLCCCCKKGEAWEKNVCIGRQQTYRDLFGWVLDQFFSCQNSQRPFTGRSKFEFSLTKTCDVLLAPCYREKILSCKRDETVASASERPSSSRRTRSWGKVWKGQIDGCHYSLTSPDLDCYYTALSSSSQQCSTHLHTLEKRKASHWGIHPADQVMWYISIGRVLIFPLENMLSRIELIKSNGRIDVQFNRQRNQFVSITSFKLLYSNWNMRNSSIFLFQNYFKRCHHFYLLRRASHASPKCFMSATIKAPPAPSNVTYHSSCQA